MRAAYTYVALRNMHALQRCTVDTANSHYNPATVRDTVRAAVNLRGLRGLPIRMFAVRENYRSIAERMY